MRKPTEIAISKKFIGFGVEQSDDGPGLQLQLPGDSFMRMVPNKLAIDIHGTLNQQGIIVPSRYDGHDTRVLTIWPARIGELEPARRDVAVARVGGLLQRLVDRGSDAYDASRLVLRHYDMLQDKRGPHFAIGTRVGLSNGIFRAAEDVVPRFMDDFSQALRGPAAARPEDQPNPFGLDLLTYASKNTIKSIQFTYLPPGGETPRMVVEAETNRKKAARFEAMGRANPAFALTLFAGMVALANADLLARPMPVEIGR